MTARLSFDAAALERTRFEVLDGVGLITLDYPERMNAWGPVMEAEVRSLMDACAADPAVRVIVLTGAGRAFCAGADMAAMQSAAAGASAPAPKPRVDGDYEQRYSYLAAVPKPIICAINGACAGVGLAISMFCDIRYASESAKLAAVFAKRGLVAEHGIAWMLPRIVGLSAALEWLMSARTLSAAEAREMGFVSAVLPDDDFRAEVIRRAARLGSEASPRTTAIIKHQVYSALSEPLTNAIHRAEDELPGCLASEDFREGVSHFVEKRPARFTGR